MSIVKHVVKIIQTNQVEEEEEEEIIELFHIKSGQIAHVGNLEI